MSVLESDADLSLHFFTDLAFHLIDELTRHRLAAKGGGRGRMASSRLVNRVRALSQTGSSQRIPQTIRPAKPNQNLGRIMDPKMQRDQEFLELFDGIVDEVILRGTYPPPALSPFFPLTAYRIPRYDAGSHSQRAGDLVHFPGARLLLRQDLQPQIEGMSSSVCSNRHRIALTQQLGCDSSGPSSLCVPAEEQACHRMDQQPEASKGLPRPPSLLSGTHTRYRRCFG